MSVGIWSEKCVISPSLICLDMLSDILRRDSVRSFDVESSCSDWIFAADRIASICSFADLLCSPL